MDMSGTLSAVSGIVMSIGVTVIGIILFGVVMYVCFMIAKKVLRYNFECIIFEKDGYGKPIMSKDRGGVFVDEKTKIKRFFLKNNFGASLDPDHVPYLSFGQKKVVFLLKRGTKNFRYIKSFEQLFSDKMGIFAQPISVGEDDVNWAYNDYERLKQTFGSTTLEKLIPYIGLAMMGVFILAMVYMVFQKFGVVVDAAKAMEKAAQALASVKSGTTIIQ